MPTPEPTAVRDELAAMKRVAAALDSLHDLDTAARERVLHWVAGRYWPGTDLDEETL